MIIRDVLSELTELVLNDRKIRHSDRSVNQIIVLR